MGRNQCFVGIDDPGADDSFGDLGGSRRRPY